LQRLATTSRPASTWRRLLRNSRLWLVVAAALIGLFAFLSFRAWQLGPLLFPPPQATGSSQLAGFAADWPTGRHDLGGTGATGVAAPAPPLTPLWELDAPGTISATPAVVGTVIYITTQDGIVAALDTASGDTLWSYDVGSPSDSAPAVSGQAVYLGARDHRILALDRETGLLLWEHNLGNIVLASPTVADGTVYVGSSNSLLEALDAATGEPRWSTRTNGWVVSHVATDGEVVAATSLGERFITADPDTGRRRLKFYTGTPVAGGPVIADGRAYFVTNRGAVWAVDPHAISRPFSRFAYVAQVNFFAWRLRSTVPQQVGSLWVGSAGGRVKFSPVYANGYLLVTNETGLITALDGATGREVWSHQLEMAEVVAEPVAAANLLIIATSGSRLMAFDVANGNLAWEYDLVARGLSAAPAVVDGAIYLPTSDGKLLALGGQTP
jgi:outer membrane protein assembly factor BamB